MAKIAILIFKVLRFKRFKIIHPALYIIDPVIKYDPGFGNNL